MSSAGRNGLTVVSSGFPSYQKNSVSGKPSRSGNTKRILDVLGYVSGLSSEWSKSSTVFGYPSFAARKGRFAVWHAISPSAPVPKSNQPRQLNGAYTPVFRRREGGTSGLSGQVSLKGRH